MKYKEKIGTAKINGLRTGIFWMYDKPLNYISIYTPYTGTLILIPIGEIKEVVFYRGKNAFSEETIHFKKELKDINEIITMYLEENKITDYTIYKKMPLDYFHNKIFLEEL